MSPKLQKLRQGDFYDLVARLPPHGFVHIGAYTTLVSECWGLRFLKMPDYLLL